MLATLRVLVPVLESVTLRLVLTTPTFAMPKAKISVDKLKLLVAAKAMLGHSKEKETIRINFGSDSKRFTTIALL
ncbi:hypothetical protein GALL_498770 [mine drainage metagenome]|uniref:Uncharacterized protein n=1 Tax=mine drainage metagenome TaxID=410659 RepID=A0A1J5PBF0_9ZZZZ